MSSELMLFKDSMISFTVDGTDWNYLEGSHLAKHASWQLYPLAFVYKIFPRTFLFHLLHGLSMALSLLIVIKAARKLQGSARWMLLLLLHPFFAGLMLARFTPEDTALPFLLLGLISIESDTTGKKAAWLLLAALAKETIAFAILIVLVVHWLRRCRRSDGTSRYFLGLAVAVLLIAVVDIQAIHYAQRVNSLPDHNKEFYFRFWYLIFEAAKGNTLPFTSILRMILFYLTNLSRLAYLFSAGVFLFPLLFAKKIPWTLLTGFLAAVAINFLSYQGRMRSPFGQYQLIVLAFAVALLLTVLADSDLEKRAALKRILVPVYLLAVIGCWAVRPDLLTFLSGRSSMYRWDKPTDPAIWSSAIMGLEKDRVPQNAIIIVPPELAMLPRRVIPEGDPGVGKATHMAVIHADGTVKFMEGKAEPLNKVGLQ